MRRFDDARQRLYDEVSYRDELTDDEADLLFAWGEAQFAVSMPMLPPTPTPAIAC